MQIDQCLFTLSQCASLHCLNLITCVAPMYNWNDPECACGAAAAKRHHSAGLHAAQPWYLYDRPRLLPALCLSRACLPAACPALHDSHNAVMAMAMSCYDITWPHVIHCIDMCNCRMQAARKAHAELKAARKSLAPPPRLTSSGLALLKASQQVLPGSWRAVRCMRMRWIRAG